MGTPQQLVDSYLGPNTYDEWQKMDQQERNAEHEYWQNRIRLRRPVKRVAHLHILEVETHAVTSLEGTIIRA